MPKTRRRKPAGPAVPLPKLSPHWHPPGCDCEPSRPYIRVSKVGTREQVISPELQLRSIEGWAKVHKKKLLEPYCDINRSGRTFRKRSIDKIIKEIADGGYKHVSLWKWSRWARNPEESAKYLKKIRDAGGWVDSATEDADQTSAIGKLQVGILREFDAYTSNVMQETWRGVHERRREAGLPHGGRERFGYDYVEVRDKEGRLIDKKYEIIDDEAQFLREAYGLYINGASFNKILIYFKSTGTTTTLGGEWTSQGIARMLDTGFAAGLIRERSAPGESPSNSIKDYDVWRPGAHEAIIKRAVWDAYKKRRLEQASLPPRSRRAAHELSALLYCVLCRRRLVTKYAGAGRTHQWQCPWQRSFHPGIAITVNNRLSIIAVRDWVRAQFGQDLPVGAYTDRATAEFARKSRTLLDERAKIDDEISVVEGKIEGLLDLAESARGKVREGIQSRLDAYQSDIDRLTILRAKTVEKTIVPKDHEALRTLDEVWEELPSDVLREALSKLVSRIEVSPRSSTSSRKTAADRVHPVGVWDEPELSDWLAERPA